MTDTPIYDDTVAWQRRERAKRLYASLRTGGYITVLNDTTHITRNFSPLVSTSAASFGAPAPLHRPPPTKEPLMSRRDVQLLFWSMVIAGFFGVMFALALNGWFD